MWNKIFNIYYNILKIMNKKILFGAIFSICIIMLVNTSSAVEYKTVINYNNNLLESKLENINIFIEKIIQTIENIEVKSIDLKSTNELDDLSYELSELRISIVDNPSLPKFLCNLLNFIISLLFSIIGTIIGTLFGKILGPLLVLLVRILTAPAVLLAKIIAFIFNLLTQ